MCEKYLNDQTAGAIGLLKEIPVNIILYRLIE